MCEQEAAPLSVVVRGVEGAAAVAAERLVLRLKQAQTLRAARTQWWPLRV